MKDHFIIVLAVFFLLTTSSHTANAEMACALDSEKHALDVRALQSQLMVAALSCGERDNYNNFIKEHKNELIKNSVFLKNYFKRNYHDEAEVQMNNFVTTLANESSKKSLDANQVKFCQEAREIFSQVHSAKTTMISDVAGKKEFSGLHKITQCN